MIRVGVIGAESTGKSTLCKQLAEQYGYRWVKEYAREYVERLARPYTEADLDKISRKLIEQISAKYDEQVVLFDTELIIMKVWYAHVYKHVPAEVEQAIRDYPMDAYLIMVPDLPAEADPVRENLDKREYFHEWYVREVQQTGLPYYLISGRGEERTRAAWKAIEEIKN